MKREDFEPDDLQGMLIAYLDNQLVGQEKKDFEDLLSRHEDLQADLEIYKLTSSKLTELFEMNGVETPLSVEQNIRQASAFGDGVVEPSHTPEYDRVFFEPSEKIASFAAAKEKRSRLFSFQGIMQMAAALALGVIIGPSLMDQFNSSDDTQYREALKLRGTVGLPDVKDNSPVAIDRPLDLMRLSSKINKDGISVTKSAPTINSLRDEGPSTLKVGDKIYINFYSIRDGKITIKYEGFNKAGDLKVSDVLAEGASLSKIVDQNVLADKLSLDQNLIVSKFEVPKVDNLRIIVDLVIGDTETITYKKSFKVD